MHQIQGHYLCLHTVRMFVSQVMVFVHARNETVRTAMLFRDFAKNNGQVGVFLPEQGPSFGEAQKNVRSPCHSVCLVLPFGCLGWIFCLCLE